MKDIGKFENETDRYSKRKRKNEKEKKLIRETWKLRNWKRKFDHE